MGKSHWCLNGYCVSIRQDNFFFKWQFKPSGKELTERKAWRSFEKTSIEMVEWLIGSCRQSTNSTWTILQVNEEERSTVRCAYIIGVSTHTTLSRILQLRAIRRWMNTWNAWTLESLTKSTEVQMSWRMLALGRESNRVELNEVCQLKSTVGTWTSVANALQRRLFELQLDLCHSLVDCLLANQATGNYCYARRNWCNSKPGNGMGGGDLYPSRRDRF